MQAPGEQPATKHFRYGFDGSYMALADACGKRKLGKPQLGAVQTRVASITRP